MACSLLSLTKFCVRLGELCGKPDKQEASRNEKKLGSRRSFHQPRDSHKESDTLLQLAAEVAWSNIDLYTQPALDGLPDDLAQLLLDKLVYAGKLNQAVLAKFTSHRLSSLQLSGISDVTDAWLLMSESFTLQRLSLAGCVQITDHGLQHVRSQRQMRTLDLSGCTGLTDAGLEHLAGLDKLKSLSLSDCEAITRLGLNQLRGLTALIQLNLEKCRQLSTLRPLGGMVRLRHLNLDSCGNIHDDTVLHVLPWLKQLEDLRLSRCQITDAGLAGLQRCSRLQRLDLAGCEGLSNACMPHIIGLKHLLRLSMEHCRLSDPGLRQLSALTTLEHLNVAYARITEVAILAWTTLTNLRTLILDSCTSVQDGCMVLLKRLPLLEVLDLSDTLVTNDGLVHLEPLRHIRSVSLSYTGGPQGVSDLGTARLSKLVSLEALNLDMRSIGDCAIRNLTRLTNLRHLDLFGAKVSDTGCSWLKHLAALESLEICGGAVTDAGVAHMGSLQALRHLSLAQNTRITDASLLVLSALTNLTFLNLSQSRLTGNGIQHLQSLSRLEVLNVTSTRVRRPAADRLQAIMPNLQALDC